MDDFEPRYVPESANFARIEELQEIAELAASGKGAWVYHDLVYKMVGEFLVNANVSKPLMGKESGKL